MAMLIFFVLINKKMPSLKVTIIYIELLIVTFTFFVFVFYIQKIWLTTPPHQTSPTPKYPRT